VHLSSLLSTAGDEEGMLEDCIQAMSDLQLVRVAFTEVLGGVVDPVIAGSRDSIVIEVQYTRPACPTPPHFSSRWCWLIACLLACLLACCIDHLPAYLVVALITCLPLFTEDHFPNRLPYRMGVAGINLFVMFGMRLDLAPSKHPCLFDPRSTPPRPAASPR